ncbi:probable G-protein coupled receptor 19 [Spea bombifrons]|uniref:probable G-protein coupled receptor 19 n=1 Tax=Spea bombifrons TaxID=233779 RepID=UPI00234B66A9|nr:probable G-protein coupled receptor 19 [Spea bombifrons]
MVFARGMDSQMPHLILPTVLYQMPNTSVVTCPMPAGDPWVPGLYKDGTTGRRNTTMPVQLLVPGEVAAVSLIFGVIWILSVFGNALVCLVIHRSRRTQSTTNYFVVSLACADLLLSLGSAPFTLLQVTSGRWILGSSMCKLARYFYYLTPGVQIYVLLSICLDRFYTILYPLSFKVSREKAKRMIAASWLFDAAFVAPVFFFYDSVDGHCNFFPPPSWDGAAYGVVHLLVGFLVPAALIILFYQKVVKYIWRIGTDGFTVRRTMNIVPRTKVKTIKMFLMLNAIFLVTWLPFYVVQLWHPDESDRRQSCLAYLAVSWLSFGSSAAKPTLYSVYNANFRRGMKETFCMSSMKCYRSNAYTITTSSRMAKRNYVGICEIPAPAKTTIKESVYDSFDREAKEKKLAWPIDSNPPNTFV